MLIPMVVVAIMIALHVPYINVFASVYRSQVKIVEKYLNEEDHGGVDIKSAQSSFRALEYSAGRKGREYVEDIELNGDEGIYKALDSYGDYYYSNDGERIDRIIIAYASNSDDIDISEYSREYYVNADFAEDTDFDLSNLKFNKGYNSYCRSEDVFWYLDVEDFINGYTDLYDGGSEEEQKEYMYTPIDFEDGSRLYITHLRYGVTEDGKVVLVDIEGRYFVK